MNYNITKIAEKSNIKIYIAAQKAFDKITTHSKLKYSESLNNKLPKNKQSY